MSEEQQSVIFSIYQDLLNSLDAPAQVLIRIRHFNRPSENFEPEQRSRWQEAKTAIRAECVDQKYDAKKQGFELGAST